MWSSKCQQTWVLHPAQVDMMSSCNQLLSGAVAAGKTRPDQTRITAVARANQPWRSPTQPDRIAAPVPVKDLQAFKKKTHKGWMFLTYVPLSRLPGLRRAPVQTRLVILRECLTPTAASWSHLFRPLSQGTRSPSAPPVSLEVSCGEWRGWLGAW